MNKYVRRCCVAGAICLAGMPVMAQESARLASGEKVFGHVEEIRSAQVLVERTRP